MALAFLLATLLSQSPVQAGPWPRDAGTWFFSAQGVAEWGGMTDRQYTVRIYGEHGLTPRLTLGGKFERGEACAGEVFARWHPAHPVDALEIGVELALGVRLADRAAAGQDHEVTQRASLHLGRGFESPLGNGWVRPSLSASGTDIRHFDAGEAYGQIGLRPTESALAMLSASAHRDAYGTTLNLSPAIGRDFGNGYTAVLEYTFAQPQPTRALSLGLWREF